MRRRALVPGIVLIWVLGACFVVTADERVEFRLGLEVFLDGYTHLVQGKRVALLTNQTGRDAQGRSTIDLLYRHPNVRLVKLFAPEHGIRGKLEAGEFFGSDTADRQTGLPIVSLYAGAGGFRPRKEHLADVDVLIYDIQDVGSRAYTYIWSLVEAMTACGEHDVAVIVLDRPCPFGANTIDGPLCNPRIKSLLTRFPLPRVYGMTVGELAAYFNRMHKLKCHLTVIPMAGYRRGMRFEATGLKWTASSPNIPNLNAARCFPATGTIGVTGQVHIGIQTNGPFQLVGAPWLRSSAAARDLNKLKLPGVLFGAASFRSVRGLFKGKIVHAVLLRITHAAKLRPATTELAILLYLTRRYPRKFRWEEGRRQAFDRAMGTSSVRQAIERGDSLETILKRWAKQQAIFKKDRKRYLIYK